MKLKSLLKTIKVLVVVIAFAFTTNIQAATGGHNNQPKPKVQQPKHKAPKHKKGHQQGGHHKVPLDGGLSILLLGAAAFGVKKLRGNKNE